MNAMSAITLLVLLISCGAFVRLWRGARRLKRLADIPPVLEGAAPRVSIIVASLDE